MPMTAVIGVRSSWLIMARKPDLASPAASERASSCVSSRLNYATAITGPAAAITMVAARDSQVVMAMPPA